MEALSKLHRKKLERLFDLYDADDNGVIELADFKIVSDNFGELSGMGSEEHEKLTEEFESFWYNLKEYADVDDNEKVSMKEWQDYWGYLMKQGQTGDVVESFGNLFLRMIDIENSGQITEKAYERYIKAFQADDFDISETFERIDTDDDGVLSYDELMSIAKNYFASADADNPGNWLFGPLN